MNLTENDELIAQYPVIVGSQLGQYLHLVQIPTHTSQNPISNSAVAFSGRFKKASRRLELEVPINTKHTSYTSEYSKELAKAACQGSMRIVGSSSEADGLTIKSNPQQIDRVRLSGGPVPVPQAKYFVGRMRGGSVHLHPVGSIIQLRPSLWHLDEIDARTKATSRKLTQQSPVNGDAPSKAVQLQFKRKETEEQVAARLCSYAYLQRKIDDEPWVELAHYAESSLEACEVAEKLCQAQAETSSAVSFQEIDTQSYIQQLFSNK